MGLDPRFEQKRTQIAHDLAKVQALCWHLHACALPFRIIAVSKIVEDLHISIIPHLAPERETEVEDSIIETATCALRNLGYLTKTTGARSTSAGFVVFPSELSAHEQLAAIRSFRS